MGPEAGADLYMKIIRYFQTEYGAQYDAGFPAFVMYSVPIPDIVYSTENELVITSMLSDASAILEKSGCDFIIIACNSVQYLLSDLQERVSIPIIGIADVNAQYASEKGYKKLGILSTDTTIRKGVYKSAMEKANIRLLAPTGKDQELVTRVIMAQLAGKEVFLLKEKLLGVIDGLKKRGADAVLLACTELPLVVDQADSNLPIVDCTQVYATEAAQLSFANSIIEGLED